MLKPTVAIKKFEEKYGFKRCKGSYGKSGCYYLCLANGCKILFLSQEMFTVIDWEDDDPRIHKKANCKYSDKRTWEDFYFDIIKNGMVRSCIL